jgi:two-component system sensor histidine kinase UhpB
MLLALGTTSRRIAGTTIWRTAGIALGVALAYYLGALLGFSLRLPSSGISFLWPPTAILTAILLSLAPRSWLAANLGAFAAHAIAHSADGLPTSTWLVQFAANCLQATLGAGLARSLYSGPIGFSNLRSVVVFVFAVVLVAPSVASMIAANVYVSMGWSATFGAAWRSRELSNILAALTFTPLVMVAIARFRHERAGGSAPSPPAIGWRVPLLSAAILVIGLMAGEYALDDHSKLPGVTPADRLLIVQLIIAVSAVPLMLLAALFTESQSDHRALTESQARSRELAGRLLLVQEEERARIARNLHDNVSQGLAALAIRLAVLERDSVPGDAIPQQTLAELRGSAIALGEQLRHFSHELHPSILQRAGLPAALAAYCNQFAADHNIDVRCTSTLAAPDVSGAAALCLYRVCQESLHNIARHAQARQVVVTLSSTAEEMHLTVRDDGRGFDMSRDIGNLGIGLPGADERLRLLCGSLIVQSEAGAGTTVRASLPIGATL